MAWRFLFLTMAAFLLALWQIVFSALLPFSLFAPNWLLTILLFLLLAVRPAYVFWLALLGGFFLETFSLSPFGLFIASLLLGLAGVSVLFHYFFTKHSLPAIFVLGILGTLLFHFVFLFLSFLFVKDFAGRFFSAWPDYAIAILWETGLNTSLLLLIYFVVSRFSQRLKTIFLITK